ncbi:MAG: TonB-dependent receptor [Myxococcales bacterium]|nr:TonB-dependent receptor [Myxococcales bacterium]MCB9534082.1 TonB-dependent receptor [Myxococcales bacterium]
MRSTRASSTLLLAVCVELASVRAAAEGEPTFRSQTRAGVEAGESIDAEGPQTVLDLSDVAESTSSLADELGAAPSTSVVRSGALGAPAFVSIRGADPWQVRVVLDGVPLNGAQSSSFDLSSLPVELVGSVVVHRSNVHVQLGAPLPGGVLELQTRFGRSGARVTAAGGSFGTRRVSASEQASGGLGDLLVSAVYSGANNRFLYFDDGATPLNTDDDRSATRRNAHVDTGGLLVRHLARVAGWRLTSLALGTVDTQGVPGLGADPALQTSLSRGRLFAALRAEPDAAGQRAASVAGLLATSLELQRYQDPASELGLGTQDERERSWLVLAGVRPTLRPHDSVVIDGVLDWTGEGYRPDDQGRRPRLAGLVRRDTLAGGAQATWSPWGRRLELEAAGRADVSTTRSDVDGLATRASDVAWSPHAGVALEPWQDRDWSVRGFASAGMADRVPGFFELYGDRGATVGNPDLRPEHRVGYDVGLQFSGARGAAAAERERVHGALTWVFFDRRVDDLILFVQTGLGAAVAQNIASAAIRGHELAFAGGWSDVVRLGATWSLIDAIDRSDGPEHGSQLPGRPVHTFAGSAATTWRWLELEYRVDGNGEFYVDRQERRPMPARLEHDVALSARPTLPWKPVLRVELRNVADARTERVELPDGGRSLVVDRAIADFVGQPLPGRAFYANLTLYPGDR